MVKDEARHTAVYEFDNNVAHSYRNVSVCMHNQLPYTSCMIVMSIYTRNLSFYVKQLSYALPELSSFITDHRVCNLINKTGVIIVAGSAYPSGETEFTPTFQWRPCSPFFSCICMFYILLFVLCHFTIVLFDIQIMIAHLVSSNSPLR